MQIDRGRLLASNGRKLRERSGAQIPGDAFDALISHGFIRSAQDGCHSWVTAELLLDNDDLIQQCRKLTRTTSGQARHKQMV